MASSLISNTLYLKTRKLINVGDFDRTRCISFVLGHYCMGFDEPAFETPPFRGKEK